MVWVREHGDRWQGEGDREGKERDRNIGEDEINYTAPAILSGRYQLQKTSS
jgi:hypothetical protein